MRTHLTTALLLTLSVSGRVWAAEKTAPTTKAPTFSLTPAESDPSASKFSDAQLAFVQSWIKQKAPECPSALSGAVAERFLEELQQRSPAKYDRLLSADFSSGAFESMLLRQVALKLTGSSQGPQREELARRRVGGALAAGGRESRVALADATGLIAKIKDDFFSQYRRLVEGKMDDDDLEILLKKTSQAGTAPKEAIAAKPKVLTAADIVSEFSRHNQVGSAMQRLQAYSIEGKLKTVRGEVQELLLLKMRPDRFRLVVRTGGVTRLIIGSDGEHFWQQVPGQPTKLLTAQEMGPRLYLAEFADPLFVGEGYAYERKEDGGAAGQEFHRVSVRRPDGSGYVAYIDAATFRETGRESDDRSVAHYSDFRDVGGVTYAFREEITDATGRKGVFEISRLVPNPGLIADLFELPVQQNKSYFEVEQLLAQGTPTGGKSNR